MNNRKDSLKGGLSPSILAFLYSSCWAFECPRGWEFSSASFTEPSAALLKPPPSRQARHETRCLVWLKGPFARSRGLPVLIVSQRPARVGSNRSASPEPTATLGAVKRRRRGDEGRFELLPGSGLTMSVSINVGRPEATPAERTQPATLACFPARAPPLNQPVEPGRDSNRR